jgi:glycosyltransferase involved in cell wall biosynthesis
MNITILTTTTSKNAAGGVERFSSYIASVFSEHTIQVLGCESLTKHQRSLLKLSRYVGMYQPTLGYLLGSLAARTGFDICITNGMLGWNIRKGSVLNIQHGTFAKSADRIDAGRNFLKFFIKKYVWGYFEGLAARRAKQCIAVSQEVKESVEHYYHANNVQVILNAVDTEHIKPLDKIQCRNIMNLPLDRKIALFVGRFEYAKGKDIIDGIQHVFTARGDIVIIAESYSQKELLYLYNAADVFLLPSLQEGCSYALLDAISVGLPFFASSVGLVSDFFQEGRFGQSIVINQTIDSYMQKIDELFNKSEEQINALKEELRRYILQYHTLEKFKESYMGIIQKIHD